MTCLYCTNPAPVETVDGETVTHEICDECFEANVHILLQVKKP